LPTGTGTGAATATSTALTTMLELSGDALAQVCGGDPPPMPNPFTLCGTRSFDVTLTDVKHGEVFSFHGEDPASRPGIGNRTTSWTIHCHAQ
jgi:hypothetical protein